MTSSINVVWKVTLECISCCNVNVRQYLLDTVAGLHRNKKKIKKFSLQCTVCTHHINKSENRFFIFSFLSPLPKKKIITSWIFNLVIEKKIAPFFFSSQLFVSMPKMLPSRRFNRAFYPEIITNFSLIKLTLHTIKWSDVKKKKTTPPQCISFVLYVFISIRGYVKGGEPHR